ncbi:MAG: GNAT family N-acetyltransferase [Pseudomonadota bacterium]
MSQWSFTLTYRDYDSARDLKAVTRIWKEVGWIQDEAKDADRVDIFFRTAADALVATIDDVAECAVVATDGTIKYQQETLQLGAVTAVTTSRVARKLGFAGDLTARLLARQATAGKELAALGMFEQGFYDKLGFGTGAYEQWIRFDPATLTVSHPFRPPRRLGIDDYPAIHQAMCNRLPAHGSVTIVPPELIKAELAWTDEPFGLGYFDGPDGTLSHFIWGSAKGEHGPYTITWRAWQSAEQLLELLALIRSLGDQVTQVSMLEMAEIQLQDLLKQPFRHRRLTRGGDFANRSNSFAYWQMRILDLPACIERTHLNTPTVRFNLALTDPVEAYLDDSHNWRGISGNYIVTLGESSEAVVGTDPRLPTLSASVGAFTRLWFGIRPASSLAITDSLSADPGLLRQLDNSLKLAPAHLGWDF